MKLYFNQFIISFLIMSQSVYGESWYKPKDEGWLWYKETFSEMTTLNNETTVSKNLEPTLKETIFSKKESYQDQLNKLRKSFEESLAKSILVPTLQNINETRRLHDQIFEKSETFSKLWMISYLQDTKGYKEYLNTNNLHRKIYAEEKERTFALRMRKLAKTYGLFFAFKEDCPYCHQFAPIVLEFADTYGFGLKGISKEGRTLPGLKNISKDNGTLSLINPEGIYPALYLVNPQTLEVISIAWGLVSLSELYTNIETVLEGYNAS